MSGSAPSDASPAGGSGPARPLLVVARWHPSAADPGRGRFVADQVAALAATGRVAPAVVSFAFSPLAGTIEAQARQRGAVRDGLAAALDAGASAFAPRGADGTSGVPIARLPVARPMKRIRRSSDEADDAAAVSAVLAARLPAGVRGGIVHAHTGSPDGFAALAFARTLGWPLVITEHAGFLERQLADPDELARYRAAIAGAVAIIAVSRSLATTLATALPESADRLHVIPNMVDLATFSPGDGTGRRADELLYVGGRVERKGLDVLIPAVARARASRPGIRLRLIGRSPTAELEARWRDLATVHGIGDAVSFEDQAPRDTVAMAMREATALVIASRHETFGVVAAEALACGLPVVASAIPALEETLGPDPDAVGALVAPDDVEALAAAIVATCERAARGDLPADRLRAAVAGRFGSAVVTSRLLELYDQLAPLDTAASRSSPAALRAGWPPPTAPSEPGAGVVLALDRRAAADALVGVSAAHLGRLVLVTRTEPTAVALPVGLAGVVRRPAAADDPPAGLGPSYRPADAPASRRLARHGHAARGMLRALLGLERRRAAGELRRDLAATEAGLALAASALTSASASGDPPPDASAPAAAALGGRDSEVLAALPTGSVRVVAGGPLHLLDLLSASTAGPRFTARPTRPRRR